MKKTIYVFVLNSLSGPQKVVQACHVMLDACRFFELKDERYNIILVAAKSRPKLDSIIMEAQAAGIRTMYFVEPDMEYEMTAVATEPLTDEQKKVFARYKLLQTL